MPELRPVVRIVQTHQQREGAGFVVRRPFPSRGFPHADPFLLLDEMGPVVYAPGAAVGAPDHPHRGFETVTYLLEGEVEHEDSAGHRGRLGPGDVQWMTAGDGVIHSEEPSRRLREEGGAMHGFQLWVNLPARDKRMPPRYQEIQGSGLPEATTPDGLATVKVLAGEALGVSAVIETQTPIGYQHWRFAAGARVDVPVPADHAAYVYVFSGELGVAGRPVREGQFALLGAGDAVSFAAVVPAQALLLSGVPLREPVVQYGPFVMNTEQEIREAIEDFRQGRMGQIAR